MVQQGATSSGPFDKVTGMLEGLLNNLRAQANEDTGLDQWCQQSRADNERSRLETKAAQDEASSQALWAQSAIAELEDEASFFSGEVKRLRSMQREIANARKTNYNMLSTHLS